MGGIWSLWEVRRSERLLLLLLTASALHVFQCPQCTVRLPCSKPVFREAKPGTRTWCKGCQRSIGQHLWRCPCNLPWSECFVHKAFPQQAPDDSTYRQRPPKRHRSANFVEEQGPARNVQQRLDAPPRNACTARPPGERLVSLDSYSQAGPVANPRLWGETLRRRFGSAPERPDRGTDPAA